MSFPGDRVTVGGGQRGRIPARGGNFGGGRPATIGRTDGRNFRQRPGHDATTPVFVNRRSRHTHSTVFVDSQPCHSVNVVHTSGRGRMNSVAALVVGICLAILGACILPVDPIAGILIGGFGVLTAATAGTVYGVNYRE